MRTLSSMSRDVQHDMSTSKLVADSLWQCLCPSFTPHTFSNSRAILSRQRRPTASCLATARPTGSRAASRYEAFDYERRRNTIIYNPLASIPTAESRSKIPTFESFADLDTPRRKKPKFEASTGIRKAGQGEKRELILENESTPMLYDMARTKAGLGRTRDVQDIVQHLVTERKEKPSLRLYSALILSNINPSEGAAWRVASLLEEMADEGIVPDVGICHDVLKVRKRMPKRTQSIYAVLGRNTRPHLTNHRFYQYTLITYSAPISSNTWDSDGST